MASDTRAPAQREKVALRPGFHLADWLRLHNVRTPAATIKKITKTELSAHASEFDCWTAYNGRVFDITSYIPYHPGGEQKLTKLAAGRDCTALFNKYHAWVNMDSILGKCFIGMLINDEVLIEEGDDGKEEEESKEA